MSDHTDSELAAYWQSIADSFQHIEHAARDHVYAMVLVIPNATAKQQKVHLSDTASMHAMAYRLFGQCIPDIVQIRCMNVQQRDNDILCILVGTTGPDDLWHRLGEMTERAFARFAQRAESEQQPTNFPDSIYFWWYLMNYDEPILGLNTVSGRCSLPFPAVASKVGLEEIASAIGGNDSELTRYTRLVPNLARAGYLYASNLAKAFQEDAEVASRAGPEMPTGADGRPLPHRYVSVGWWDRKLIGKDEKELDDQQLAFEKEWDARNARWKRDYGMPLPTTEDQWTRLLSRVGMTPQEISDILTELYGIDEIIHHVEGYLDRVCIDSGRTEPTIVDSNSHAPQRVDKLAHDVIDEKDLAILAFLNRSPSLRRKVADVLPEKGPQDRKAIARRLRKLADRTPPLVDYPKDARLGVVILRAGVEALMRATAPTPR